jgi:ABC-type multidrug transport system ATPase subunit
MTMADIAALSIENVTMAYGRKTVMENLSLSVGRGETFGLMGLNGAG